MKESEELLARNIHETESSISSSKIVDVVSVVIVDVVAVVIVDVVSVEVYYS